MSQYTQRVHRFVSNDFTVRVAAVNATEVVREMQILQQTYPLPTVAVGRAMVGALLMASHFKDGQKIGVYFKGNGPMGHIYAEANFDGSVRGYTPHQQYQPESYDHQLSLKSSIGSGYLIVDRHQPFQRQPHQATVDLKTSEIGDDIAYYLHQSHQIRSIVSLGVYLDSLGKVLAAGGLIVEVMPGVEDQIVEILEKNYEKNKAAISPALLQGKNAADLVAPFLEGIPFTEVPHDYPIKYSCPCTKDRVMAAMTTFGADGLQEILDDQEDVSITCQMCGRPYEVTLKEIKDLQSSLATGSVH